jgi:Tfp pilus assembly protein PilO
MKESTKRNLSLILIIVFFIVAFVVFFNYTWPALLKVLDANDKLKVVKQNYAKQLQSLQMAKQIIDQYKNLTNVNQTISLTLPKSEEIYNVITQLNKISQNSGLLLQSISLQRSAPTSQTTSTTKTESLINKPQTITLTLNLVGTYEAFKTWLEAIETNIRLMDITNINFSGVMSSEKSTTANIFNYRVTLNTYYQP